jgi:hypothetical protein
VRISQILLIDLVDEPFVRPEGVHRVGLLGCL